MNIKKTNIREKQAIGAIALKCFCSKYQIKYNGIDELVQHLLNILTTENLPDWNEEGLHIAIIGRGEQLPEGLKACIPTEIYATFFSLIENVVEIGISNMFSAYTKDPHIHLLNSLRILKKHKVKIPLPSILFNENSSRSWGGPWTDEKLQKLKDELDYSF